VATACGAGGRPQPGGQIRADRAKPAPTRDAEHHRLAHGAAAKEQGVEFRFNTLAEADTVLALAPDVVIIATGGLPHTDVLQSGNELVASCLGHSQWRRQAA